MNILLVIAGLANCVSKSIETILIQVHQFYIIKNILILDTLSVDCHYYYNTVASVHTIHTPNDGILHV